MHLVIPQVSLNDDDAIEVSIRSVANKRRVCACVTAVGLLLYVGARSYREVICYRMPKKRGCRSLRAQYPDFAPTQEQSIISHLFTISQLRKRESGSLGVSEPRRIDEIIHGNRSITADTALRLARYFGTSPEFWPGSRWTSILTWQRIACVKGLSAERHTSWQAPSRSAGNGIHREKTERAALMANYIADETLAGDGSFGGAFFVSARGGGGFSF